MKATETYLILCEMQNEKITLREAHEKILRLFSVVGRSEQLVCKCKNTTRVVTINGVSYCEVCDEVKAN